MTEKGTRLTNMNKPVPMKLFAAWEVDRTPPNCIPRWEYFFLYFYRTSFITTASFSIKSRINNIFFCPTPSLCLFRGLYIQYTQSYGIYRWVRGRLIGYLCEILHLRPRVCSVPVLEHIDFLFHSQCSFSCVFFSFFYFHQRICRVAVV